MASIKNKKSNEQNEKLAQALKGRKLPIITLDEKWYGLFPEHLKTPKIKKLEKNLMDLVKKQGEMTNEIKSLKKRKSQLMSQIVDNMEVSNDSENAKRTRKVESSKQQIEEINTKIEDMEDELNFELPKLIEDTNFELILESINDCYQRMMKNNSTISEVSEWILIMRNQLKEKILIKQDCEMANTQIYGYMHDIMGPDLMEIFDINKGEDNK